MRFLFYVRSASNVFIFERLEFYYFSGTFKPHIRSIFNEVNRPQSVELSYNLQRA
uniref:Uncharacterized protein n=1 Tax=Arundo donax TaxID=35708 RepID=A0A0A9HRD4_ARUDO